MSENDIRNACHEWLLYHGWLVIRPNSGVAKPERADGSRGWVPFNRWQVLGQDEEKSGVSDLLAFKGALRLAIETKVPGNTPTETQVKFMAAWEAAGGLAIVARGIEDLEAVL